MKEDRKEDRFVQRIFDQENTKSAISEAFRAIRANLQFTSIDREVKTILLSSTKPREGKSTVAFNLAASLALTHKQVLLIDADLRKPRIHRFLDDPNYVGLTNILSEDIDFIPLIHIVEGFENFHTITSGPLPPNPSELLSSKRMKSFIEKVQPFYDYVLIDSPPVGSVADAVILSALADGVIVVAEAGAVKRDELIRTKESFEKVGAKILGVILNGVSKEVLPYDYYYDYHSS